MIIVRISPGLANQIYEFASGYALAKELGQELAADISECLDSACDYCLDYFKIPSVKKIVYHMQDIQNGQHTNPGGILAQLRESARVLVDKENDEGCFVYKSLQDAEMLQHEDNLYMCGYFFDREKYYLKYWDEIREIFTLRNESAEIMYVKELIKNRISVGVHIRRGDMLLAEWAVPMEDDYYRAAIELCREHFGDCIFLIFSDDIEYAKKMLGQDGSLYYVHFLGYSDADMNEFVSLSLCDHRIMSNSSTFSKLADELNWKEERKTFWKESSNRSTAEKSSNINFAKRNIRLNQFDIKTYSRRYKVGEGNDDPYIQLREEVLRSKVDAHNYRSLLDKICICSMNVFGQDAAVEKELAYQKFLCLIQDKQYGNALQTAFRLYHDYAGDRDFMAGLIEALSAFEAREEAAVEQAGMESADKKRRFLIIPYADMIASSKIVAIVELGLVLQHMGHDVSFIFSPMGNEEHYIRKNRYLTNRQGVCLGCRQYLLEDVQKAGISNFLNTHFTEDIIIVSRRAEFFIDKEEYRNGNMKYVFPDFFHNGDAEMPASRNMGRKEWEQLYDRADVVLTKQKIKGNGKQKIVRWEDNDSRDAYLVVEDRWDLGREHRLSRRVIGMAAALLDHL